MTEGSVSPAILPPHDFPGLRSEWSRLVTTPVLDDAGRTWHILDNGVKDPKFTLLCVHGNPTWSYLWRDLLADAPPGVRVIAIDHLDMGFSERTGTVRRLSQRIDDLCALTDELELTGPVVTVAHDWGGPISLGWAERHVGQLTGIVLMNTAVNQPAGSPAPSLIRAVRMPVVLKNVCETTPAFIRGTMALSRPRLSKAVRDAYEAPYLGADRRAAIATFVEDIPLDENDPSHGALDDIAVGLTELEDVPALLLWGPSDPVFSDLYLQDLEKRLPNASVHRFVGASHLTPEDADVASAVYAWITQLRTDAEPLTLREDREPLWAAMDRRAKDQDVAIVEMGSVSASRSITFAEFSTDVEDIAAGLVGLGVEAGDRIAMLVPPGIDLAASIFAAWRVRAVPVLGDAGLGLRGMGRALKSADPAYVIGIPKALSAARTMRWPGIRISTSPTSNAQQRLTGSVASLDDLRNRGEGITLPPRPGPDDDAGVGFTSGSTGPAKGVTYTHRQLQAQRDALVRLYGIGASDSLVAAFGPFALFGPLMGIPSVVPDMKVTLPGSLTAGALADAAAAINASLVFASPAALDNVAATSGALTPDQRAALAGARLLLSAGAPVPLRTLRGAAALAPNAEAHTPYGMTEVMPVADISLVEIDAVGEGEGVCVGFPIDGVVVEISAIDDEGLAIGHLTSDAGILGEICIRAEHMRDGYDKLWLTENEASKPKGWHRSGDVGHFDDEGRLWVEGRIGHVITTAYGPVTPVGIEHAIAALNGVGLAAVVGVGPVGAQQAVVVLSLVDGSRRSGLADEDLADRVRDLAGAVDIAAVLVVPSLPVDKRHNSKIDRTRIATWAEKVLAGGRMGRI